MTGYLQANKNRLLEYISLAVIKEEDNESSKYWVKIFNPKFYA